MSWEAFERLVALFYEPWIFWTTPLVLALAHEAVRVLRRAGRGS